MATLEERIKELETEQVLMQRELDSVTEAAQRSDTQLRSVSRADLRLWLPCIGVWCGTRRLDS